MRSSGFVHKSDRRFLHAKRLECFGGIAIAEHLACNSLSVAGGADVAEHGGGCGAQSTGEVRGKRYEPMVRLAVAICVQLLGRLDFNGFGIRSSIVKNDGALLIYSRNLVQRDIQGPTSDRVTVTELRELQQLNDFVDRDPPAIRDGPHGKV